MRRVTVNYKFHCLGLMLRKVECICHPCVGVNGLAILTNVMQSYILLE